MVGVRPRATITVGLLVLIGGRMVQLGMVAILGMQACLQLFGWILIIFGIFMLWRSDSCSAPRSATTAPR